jgi:hypothetical protein
MYCANAALLKLLRDINESVEFLSINAAGACLDQHYPIFQPKRLLCHQWRAKGDQCKERQKNSGAQINLPAAMLAQQRSKRLRGACLAPCRRAQPSEHPGADAERHNLTDTTPAVPY